MPAGAERPGAICYCLAALPARVNGRSQRAAAPGDWIGSLQVALQTRRLKIAKELSLRPVLVEELRDFRLKVNPLTAHDSWNAREGQHDDIVLAVAVALWHAEREARRSRQNTGSWPVIQY